MPAISLELPQKCRQRKIQLQKSSLLAFENGGEKHGISFGPKNKKKIEEFALPKGIQTSI